MSGNIWRIIEFINQSECDIDIVSHVKAVGLSVKFWSENILILSDVQNSISEVIETLSTNIRKEIIDDEDYNPKLGEEEEKKEEEEDLFMLNLYDCNEIMFSFCINNKECQTEDEALNFLSIIGKVPEYDYEYKHFERYEYVTQSKYPLFHNIEAKNIAVFHINSIECGIALVGYMIRDNKMYFTIKTFQSEVLDYLIRKFKSSYQQIEFLDNINWKSILSRKVSDGYRPSHSYLVTNPLSKQFLKTSKSSSSADNFKFVLKRLLNKGYLDEEEYLQMSEDDNISKFLHPYYIYTGKKKNGIWFGEYTGIAYHELDKANPMKIVPLNSKQKVYAPHHDLLHYIRAFWHQNFIEEAIQQIKNEWDKKNHFLRIIDIIIDYQFDFISETKPQKESRDIDCLIRVKNITSNEEYIISLEGKRNSNEYSNVVKDNKEKISTNYARKFTSFIMVSYFNIGETNRKRTIIWENGENKVEKEIFPCVEYNFSNLVESLKKIITVSCGIGDIMDWDQQYKYFKYRMMKHNG
ncbi:hypothetical protein P9B03_18665 [Metasolibacillus meyeri]|uniref:PD-(D/E)XK nuclease superfamily protein n=1 Tax=Metasolibacillus meyeri TaxID=1071052 RepID=A0AAW9NYE4_9BACL|nr:hypothetical protein [Metasolibacillus meyeri]MEC1180491.1 hypothetical protein [Metasolibacillus meyeri]